MSAFELGIVTEIFGLPLPGFESSWYQLAVCARQPGRVPIFGGAVIDARHGIDVFAAARTVIIPGGDPNGEYPDEILDAIRLAHRRGSRIVSICTGNFALAAAGVLDGRRVATHWMFADLLAERYPSVQVDSTILYAEDGNVFTSAGSAAGLDLCVHLVREDFGPTVANAMAQRLVITSHREGNHAQVIEKPVHADADDDRLTQSMGWALSNLDEAITIDSLARQAHMSTRSYIRHFASTTGTSPIRWLTTQRIQASLPLLETTKLSIEQVAIKVGFDHAATYRYHFRRTMGTSPTAYRRVFSTDARTSGMPHRASAPQGVYGLTGERDRDQHEPCMARSCR
jgi:AraC family transcriptional regulator, transcriptional activator FtrA